MKFNIVFTMGGEKEEDGMDTDEEDAIAKEEKTSGKLTKNCSVFVNLPEWGDVKYRGKISKVIANGKFNIKLDNDGEDEYEELKHVKRSYITLITEDEINEENVMSELKDLVKLRNKKGKTAMISQFEKICKIQEKFDVKKKKKEQKHKQIINVTKLRKLLREKNIMNDFKYFKTMDLDAQQKIIDQLVEVNKFTSVEKPYRLSLLDSDIPVSFKAKALKKINMLNFMDPGSGEYYKVKQIGRTHV